MFAHELPEYLPSEIQNLTKYKDKYTDEEELDEETEIPSVKIDIKKNDEDDNTFGFEMV